MLAATVNRRSVLRLAALAVAAYVLLSFAGYVASGSAKHAALVGGFGLIPLLVYVSLRWPMTFPFCLYVALVPLEPLLLAGGTTGSSLTKVGGIIFGAALIARIVVARRALVPPRAWLGWAGFVLWATCSLMWTVNEAETLQTVTMIAQLFLLYTLAALYPIRQLEPLRVRFVLVVASLLVACYGIYGYFSGQRLVGTRLSLSEGNEYIDPNHLAAALMLPLALLLASVLADRRLSVKLASGVALAVFMLDVLFTGSRGAFVGVAAATLYLAIRTGKYRWTVVATAAMLALSFAIPNVWQRFANPSQSDASGRFDIWTVGLHAFPHFWLLGSGFSTYDSIYDQYLLGSYQHTFAGYGRPSHSLLVGTSVELGIIGLALVLLAWFLSVRQTWNVPRNHPLATVAYGAEAAVVGLFVCALNLDMLWFKYLWLALMMVVITSNAIGARTLWSPRAAGAMPARLARSAGRARFVGP